MHFFNAVLAGILLFNSLGGWETDFQKAREKATREHKFIVLNFSGSDWCGPCIRLDKEIFESDAFKRFSDSQLVLVNADFPRQKKHQLSKDQQKKNESLADKYNANGAFPYTLLLDADGKIIKTWDGMPGITADQFVGQLKSLCDAHK